MFHRGGGALLDPGQRDIMEENYRNLALLGKSPPLGPKLLTHPGQHHKIMTQDVSVGVVPAAFELC